MKNLKKVLALVLVMASLFGVLTVASAADIATSAKYTDKADISKTRLEAVDVMTAIGVFAGSDNKLSPQTVLRRSEAAKIVVYMIMGEERAEQLTCSAAPFEDVPADHWAAKYIEYCSSTGILAGVGNNQFKPDGTLTGLQFAKVMLVALGYDPAVEGLTGTGWDTNVARLAIQTAGIAKGVPSLTEGLKREDAIQIAFNTEQATLVEYAGGVNVTNADGSSVKVGATRNKVGDENETTTDGYSSTATPYTQFCEKYCEKLKLNDNDVDTENFGAPIRCWKFNGKVANKTEKSPSVTYTEKLQDTAGKKTINADLKQSDFDAGGVAVTVNGVGANFVVTGATTAPAVTGVALAPTVRSVSEITANGRVVSVYVSDDNEVTDIVVKLYGLYQVSGVSGDKKTFTFTRKSQNVTLGGVNLAPSFTINDSDKNEDFYNEIAGLAKEDYIVAATNAEDSSVIELGSFTKETGVCSTVSGSKYTVGGTKYPASEGLNTANIDAGSAEYDIYLDQNGYIVYAKAVTTTDSYAYITDTSRDGSSSDGYTYSAKMLTADGTLKWTTVKKINGTVIGSTNDTSRYDSNMADGTTYKNKFVKYTVNSDDSVNFDAAPAAGASVLSTITEIKTGDTTIKGSGDSIEYTMNSKTIFVTKIGNSYAGYTGIRAIPNISADASDIHVFADTSNVAKMIYIEAQGTSGKDDEYTYVYDFDSKTTDGDDDVYIYKVLVNGVATTVESTTTQLVESDYGLYVNVGKDGDRISNWGTELTINGTVSRLGVTGNYGLAPAARGTAATAMLKDNVLTITLNDADMYKYDGATSAVKVIDEAKAFSVADDFVAYEIDETADTKTTNMVLTDDGTNLDYNTFFTFNSDGEVTAMYVIKGVNQDS